jgi:hypothetical protein
MLGKITCSSRSDTAAIMPDRPSGRSLLVRSRVPRSGTPHATGRRPGYPHSGYPTTAEVVGAGVPAVGREFGGDVGRQRSAATPAVSDRMLPTRRPGLRVGARGYSFASYLNDRLSRTRKPVTAPFSMVTS